MAPVARWSIEVQFGRKPDLFVAARRAKARVELEYEVDSLAALEKRIAG